MGLNSVPTRSPARAAAAWAVEVTTTGTPADEVTAYDAWLAALVKDLLETVDHPGRAGLAAPQIGVSARVFSYNIDGVIGHVVNPRIAELSEEIQDGDEGCLSVPGIWAPTVRAMHAVVEGFDVHGEPLRLEGAELMARCLQHEVDHLDGKVFLDRLKGEPRKQAFRMLRERTTSLP